MSLIKWASGISGNWTNASDWAGGVVPGPFDDVVVDASGIYTVTISSADAARSLTLEDVTGTIAINSGGTLTLGSALTVGLGTVQLNQGGLISGGTLAATGGAFLWNGGTIDGVTVNGPINVGYVAGSYGLIIGPHGLVARNSAGTGPGTINVTNGRLVIENSQTIDNATINLGEQGNGDTLIIDDLTGNGMTLTLGAGATINQTGTFSNIATSNYNATNNSIVNLGTIDAQYHRGKMLIAAYSSSGHNVITNFTNIGSLNIGNAENVLIGSRTFDNKGQITLGTGGASYFTAGSYTLINEGGISVAGGDFFEAGKFINAAGGDLTLASGGTLTLGNTYNAGTIAGTGLRVFSNYKIVNTGVFAITNSYFDFFEGMIGSQLSLFENLNDTIVTKGGINNTGNTLTVGAGSGLNPIIMYFGDVSGGTVIDLGGGFQWENGGLDNLTYVGALDIASAATSVAIGAHGVTLVGAGGTGPGAASVSGANSGLVLEGSLNTGGGTISLTGASSRLTFLGNVTLDNATVNLGGASSNIYQSGSSRRGLLASLGTNLFVVQSAADVAISGTKYKRDYLTNNGVIEASFAGGAFDITCSNFQNLGLIDVSNGDTLNIAPTIRFTNLGGNLISGGTFEVEAGSTLNVTAPVAIDASTLILSGAGSTIEGKSGSSETTLEASLTSIASNGTLELLNGRDWSTAKTIANAGTLALAGSTFASSSLVNSGTVSGYGVLATTLSNSGDVIVGTGQTLSLQGGALANLSGGTLSGGVFSIAVNGTLQLADNTSIATLNTVLLLNGAGSTVQGLNTTTSLEVGLKDSLTGIGAAGVLALLDGRNFTAANAISNLGILQLADGTFGGAALTDAAGSILTGYGLVSATFLGSGSVSAVGGVLAFSSKGDAFAGALGGSEIDFTGGTDQLSGGTSLSAGALGISGGATVTLGTSLGFGGALTQAAATTLALGSNTLTLSGAGSTIAGKISGGASLVFSGGSQMLAVGASIGVAQWSVTGGAATLAAPLGFKGAFTLGSGANLIVNSRLSLSGVSILSGGVQGVSVVAVANAAVSGLSLGGAVTLEVTGSASQNGTVTVGDAASAGATVTIDAGASWIMTAGDFALGAPAKSSLNVKGTLTDMASGKSSDYVNIFDTGVVAAGSGLLDLVGSVKGTGALNVAAGAGLEADALVASGISMAFEGGNGLLALSSPASFAATIHGFDATDTIDLIRIAATSATLEAGDALLIKNGSQTVATLQLSGAYSGDTFTTASDGAGGTKITLTTGAAALMTGISPALAFIHASAGLCSSQGPGPGVLAPMPDPQAQVVAAPRL